jgi:hypothetical protein
MTDERVTESPSYLRPPVVETILGVQFKPLRGLQNAHLGAFWKTLGDEWPTVADAPPLEPQFERFDAGGMWPDGRSVETYPKPDDKTADKEPGWRPDGSGSKRQVAF